MGIQPGTCSERSSGKGLRIYRRPLNLLVGRGGFEPPKNCSRVAKATPNSLFEQVTTAFRLCHTSIFHHINYLSHRMVTTHKRHKNSPLLSPHIHGLSSNSLINMSLTTCVTIPNISNPIFSSTNITSS